MTRPIISLVLMMFCTLAAAGDKMQEITVKLKVPDAAWKISIEEVLQVNDEVWVISQLRRPPMMGAHVISTVSDTVKINIPGNTKPKVKHFVIGKRWGWKNEVPYTFIEDRKELDEQLISVDKKELYKKPKKG